MHAVLMQGETEVRIEEKRMEVRGKRKEDSRSKRLENGGERACGADAGLRVGCVDPEQGPVLQLIHVAEKRIRR
jgi:hypothetical protein